ncbi:MAG: zinc-binding dehydrogenase [Candidatus Eremiobacteraeota bacterium]|nr:zinc-binding dehydrogenase [Candidatus Eremiobacteraeota bacterium]
MKAAVVEAFERPPLYRDWPEPVGGTVLQVRAAAVSQLVRARAAGKHYSGGQPPFIAGVDGVGVTPEGQRVFFTSNQGTMAERVAVERFVPIPDGLDDVRAAALANPAMSSWAALRLRARIQPGETVLINGSTGSSGQLAVKIARHLGAGRVIATGRNVGVLEALGADVVIPLDGEAAAAFRREISRGVDIVLDYLWGESALQILEAIAQDTPRLRFVQIGSISGPTIPMPAHPLRSSGLELLGSGLGSNSPRQLLEVIGELLQEAESANLTVETETAPLSEVESAWGRDNGGRRLVLIP